MSQPKIKLDKLPDTKPVKHTISVMPELEADLKAYAKVYEKAYGEKPGITEIVCLSLIHI